jgi:tetratricopeptide (TPR) repeat protein
MPSAQLISEGGMVMDAHDVTIAGGETSRVARALISEADGLLRAGRYDEAITCYDRVVGQFASTDDREIRKLVFRALSNKGSALVRLDRLNEADAAYDELSDWLGKSSTASRAAQEHRVGLVRAHAFFAAGRYEQAVAAADSCLKHVGDGQSDDPDPVVKTMLLKAEALSRSGRVPEAVKLLVELEERFDRVGKESVQTVVANALKRKAELLSVSGELEQAIEAYDDLLAHLEARPELSLQTLVVEALHGKAHALQLAARYEEALEAENKALARGEQDRVSGKSDALLDARVGKARILGRLERVSEAIALNDELIEQYGDDPDLDVQRRVANALEDKAALLFNHGRLQESVAALDDMIGRFAQARELVLRIHVARALANKAIALDRLGRLDAAIMLDDDALTRFADASEPEFAEVVARILSHKAACLQRLGQLNDSIAVWGEVTERFGDATSPELCALAEHALREKAKLLVATGRSSEAHVLSEGLIARPGRQTDPKQSAEILLTKGTALLGDERYEEAIEVFDVVIARFEENPEPALRAWVVQALNNKIAALDGLGRDEEAETLFEDLLTGFSEEALALFDQTAQRLTDAADPEAREGLASAMFAAAKIMSKLGRQDDAVHRLNKLIARFEDDEKPSIRDLVSEARETRNAIVEETTD